MYHPINFCSSREDTSPLGVMLAVCLSCLVANYPEVTKDSGLFLARTCLGLGITHSRPWGYPLSVAVDLSRCIASSVPQDTRPYALGRGYRCASFLLHSSTAAELLSELTRGALKRQHHPVLPWGLASTSQPHLHPGMRIGRHHSTASKGRIQLAIPLHRPPACSSGPHATLAQGMRSKDNNYTGSTQLPGERVTRCKAGLSLVPCPPSRIVLLFVHTYFTLMNNVPIQICHGRQCILEATSWQR